MKTARFPILTAALGVMLFAAPAFAGSVTITMDSFAPQTPYQVYAGTHVDSSTVAAALQMFSVTSSTDSAFASSGKLELFCIELAQEIAQGSSTIFQVLGADEGSKGGVFNTPTGLLGASIANAGIGSARAGNLALLYSHVFGNDYKPSLVLNTDGLKSSFQLAVWELSHDDNFDLKNASAGGFYVSSATGASVADQAQDWVTWVKNNPNATKMELLALHSDTVQDLVVPDQSKLAIIPEPSTFALLTGLGALAVAGCRRRFALVGR